MEVIIEAMFKRLRRAMHARNGPAKLRTSTIVHLATTQTTVLEITIIVAIRMVKVKSGAIPQTQIKDGISAVKWFITIIHQE